MSDVRLDGATPPTTVPGGASGITTPPTAKMAGKDVKSITVCIPEALLSKKERESLKIQKQSLIGKIGDVALSTTGRGLQCLTGLTLGTVEHGLQALRKTPGVVKVGSGATAVVCKAVSVLLTPINYLGRRAKEKELVKGLGADLVDIHGKVIGAREGSAGRQAMAVTGSALSIAVSAIPFASKIVDTAKKGEEAYAKTEYSIYRKVGAGAIRVLTLPAELLINSAFELTETLQDISEIGAEKFGELYEHPESLDEAVSKKKDRIQAAIYRAMIDPTRGEEVAFILEDYADDTALTRLERPKGSAEELVAFKKLDPKQKQDALNLVLNSSWWKLNEAEKFEYSNAVKKLDSPDVLDLLTEKDREALDEVAGMYFAITQDTNKWTKQWSQEEFNSLDELDKIKFLETVQHGSVWTRERGESAKQKEFSHAVRSLTKGTSWAELPAKQQKRLTKIALEKFNALGKSDPKKREYFYKYSFTDFKNLTQLDQLALISRIEAKALDDPTGRVSQKILSICQKKTELTVDEIVLLLNFFNDKFSEIERQNIIQLSKSKLFIQSSTIEDLAREITEAKTDLSAAKKAGDSAEAERLQARLDLLSVYQDQLSRDAAQEEQEREALLAPTPPPTVTPTDKTAPAEKPTVPAEPTSILAQTSREAAVISPTAYELPALKHIDELVGEGVVSKGMVLGGMKKLGEGAQATIEAALGTAIPKVIEVVGSVVTSKAINTVLNRTAEVLPIISGVSSYFGIGADRWVHDTLDAATGMKFSEFDQSIIDFQTVLFDGAVKMTAGAAGFGAECLSSLANLAETIGKAGAGPEVQKNLSDTQDKLLATVETWRLAAEKQCTTLKDSEKYAYCMAGPEQLSKALKENPQAVASTIGLMSNPTTSMETLKLLEAQFKTTRNVLFEMSKQSENIAQRAPEVVALAANRGWVVPFKEAMADSSAGFVSKLWGFLSSSRDSLPPETKEAFQEVIKYAKELEEVRAKYKDTLIAQQAIEHGEGILATISQMLASSGLTSKAVQMIGGLCQYGKTGLEAATGAIDVFEASRAPLEAMDNALRKVDKELIALKGAAMQSGKEMYQNYESRNWWNGAAFMATSALSVGTTLAFGPATMIITPYLLNRLGPAVLRETAHFLNYSQGVWGAMADAARKGAGAGKYTGEALTSMGAYLQSHLISTEIDPLRIANFDKLTPDEQRYLVKIAISTLNTPEIIKKEEVPPEDVALLTRNEIGFSALTGAEKEKFIKLVIKLYDCTTQSQKLHIIDDYFDIMDKRTQRRITDIVRLHCKLTSEELRDHRAISKAFTSLPKSTQDTINYMSMSDYLDLSEDEQEDLRFIGACSAPYREYLTGAGSKIHDICREGLSPAHYDASRFGKEKVGGKAAKALGKVGEKLFEERSVANAYRNLRESNYLSNSEFAPLLTAYSLLSPAERSIITPSYLRRQSHEKLLHVYDIIKKYRPEFIPTILTEAGKHAEKAIPISSKDQLSSFLVKHAQAEALQSESFAMAKTLEALFKDHIITHKLETDPLTRRLASKISTLAPQEKIEAVYEYFLNKKVELLPLLKRVPGCSYSVEQIRLCFLYPALERQRKHVFEALATAFNFTPAHERSEFLHYSNEEFAKLPKEKMERMAIYLAQTMKHFDKEVGAPLVDVLTDIQSAHPTKLKKLQDAFNNLWPELQAKFRKMEASDVAARPDLSLGVKKELEELENKLFLHESRAAQLMDMWEGRKLTIDTLEEKKKALPTEKERAGLDVKIQREKKLQATEARKLAYNRKEIEEIKQKIHVLKATFKIASKGVTEERTPLQEHLNTMIDGALTKTFADIGAAHLARFKEKYVSYTISRDPYPLALHKLDMDAHYTVLLEKYQPELKKTQMRIEELKKLIKNPPSEIPNKDEWVTPHLLELRSLEKGDLFKINRQLEIITKTYNDYKENFDKKTKELAPDLSEKLAKAIPVAREKEKAEKSLHEEYSRIRGDFPKTPDDLQLEFALCTIEGTGAEQEEIFIKLHEKLEGNRLQSVLMNYTEKLYNYRQTYKFETPLDFPKVRATIEEKASAVKKAAALEKAALLEKAAALEKATLLEKAAAVKPAVPPAVTAAPAITEVAPPLVGRATATPPEKGGFFTRLSRLFTRSTRPVVAIAKSVEATGKATEAMAGPVEALVKPKRHIFSWLTESSIGKIVGAIWNRVWKNSRKK